MSAVLPFLEQTPTQRKSHQDVLDGIAQGIEELAGVSAASLSGFGEDYEAAKKKAKKKPTLDADGQEVGPLVKAHTELTRLLWARSLVANALVGAKFKLVKHGSDLAVEVTVAPGLQAPKGGMRVDTVPWSYSSKESRTFKLFSTNSKMRCPTFDLPAGAGSLGGACPGAKFAQSTIPLQNLTMAPSGADYGQVSARGKADGEELSFLLDQVQQDWASLPADERPARAINLKSTVCTYCYATGGKYGEVSVQFSEVARFAFIRTLMGQGKSDLLEDLLVNTIENTLEWDEETTERHQVRPIRIHSSGDFFSKEYADVWLNVARRVDENWTRGGGKGPRVVLWAPTRTHVLPNFYEFWMKRKAERKIPKNFVIRPSAYTTGDPAPYIRRPSPTGSKGTSVLFEDDARSRVRGVPHKGEVLVKKKDGTMVTEEVVNMAEFGDGQYHLDTEMDPPLFRVDEHGTKFDWQCGVYSLAKGNKTCLSAIAPDGKVGCRACWTQRNLAVNYVIH